MSGPYDQQQMYGQTVARVTGVTTGHAAAHSAPSNRSGYVVQSQRQGSSSRGEHHRHHRNESTSSSNSSSYGVKQNVAMGGGVMTANFPQQYPVNNNQAYFAGQNAGFSVNSGSLGTSAGYQRRSGRYRRQVIRLPDPPQGQVRQVRCRLPTPEPDVLERVYIQRTAPEVVEEITEVPTTPPPCVQERTVIEPSGPPQVVRRVVRVPPRGGGYGSYQQQGGSFISNIGQAGGNLVGGGSYQQTGGYESVGNSYGSFGGDFQQQGVGGYSSQSAASTSNIFPANCFYV